MNKLNKNYLAFLFIFSIVLIYLYPVFLGKVDVPVDIRDIQMYPWRHYAVDKKIRKYVLSEIKSSSSKDDSITLDIFPENSYDIHINPSYNKKYLENFAKSKENYNYLTFEYSSNKGKLSSSDINVYFINKLSNNGYSVDFKTYLNPRSDNFNWFTAYLPLPKAISLKDINLYSIKFLVKNQSETDLLKLHMKDMKVVLEDFSKVPVVHNYFLDDIVQQFAPYRELYSNAIKSGALPFWTHSILTGIEFLSEPQLAYFHPLYFLLYFLFDHFTAHNLILIVSLLSCGVGTYLLSKHWGLKSGIALLTGIVYMFHPFNACWISFEHVLMCSATLPFLLLAYEKRNIIMSALLLGLIFLSGHLQHVYYTVIFFFLFVFYRLIESAFQSKKQFLKHIVNVFFVFAIGILIGAIILLPFYPIAKESYRVPWSLEFIKSTSIPLKAFLGLLFPFSDYPKWSIIERASVDWAMFRNYVYFGFLPLLFSFFSIRLLFKKSLVRFFVLTIILSLLISCGSPLFFFIRDFIPGFKELQHYRFLQIYSFSVPFLVGFGLNEFLSFISSCKIKRILIFLVIVISAIDLMYHSSFFITWSDRKNYKPLPQNGSLEFLLKKKKESKEPFRVLPLTFDYVNAVKPNSDVAKPNTLLPYGLEDVSGYSSLISKDLYNLFVYCATGNKKLLYSKEIISLFPNVNIPYPINNYDSKILDLLNVKYFLVPNVSILDSDKMQRVYIGDLAIYENLDYLPRAFIVPDYEVIENPKKTIIKLDSDEFDPQKTVILMSKPVTARKSEATPTLRSGQASQSRSYGQELIEIASSQQVAPRNDIQFLEYKSKRIKLKVQTSKSAFLVIGHNLNKNWKVKINGEAGKHIQANLVQRAVYLPGAGDYMVEFCYFPFLFIIGASVSFFGILILLGLYLSSKHKLLNPKG